jgi:perosamine synthetase
METQVPGATSLPQIYWAEPDVRDEDYRRLAACFARRRLTQAAEVAAFEAAIARLTSRKHAIAVSSGSTALVSAVLALELPEGSEVLIPALSFPAVPNAIRLAGAAPRPIDIDGATGTLALEPVGRALSARAGAVVAIDYSGLPQDWSRLRRLCDRYGVPLIVDAASSFLGEVGGYPAGSAGLLATFSFHAAKPITTGEGGAVVTDDDALARRLRSIRSHGEEPSRKYIAARCGCNFRMTELAAALGLSQLERREQLIEARQKVIDHYLGDSVIAGRALRGYRDPDVRSSGFTLTILIEERDRVAADLCARNIETRVMWPPLGMSPAYADFSCSCPQTDQFAERCLSLPTHTGLGEQEMMRILDACRDALGEQGQ